MAFGLRLRPLGLSFFAGQEAILACAVAFVAWGHMIHWLPALGWIGRGFVAGLLVSFGSGCIAILMLSRKSKSDMFHRPLRPTAATFAGTQLWKSEVEGLKRRQTYAKKPFYVESEKISEAFDKLLGYIIRDFVNSWYSNISRSPVFLNEVDGVLRAALGNLRDRLIELDLVEIVISRLVPILTNHIRDFHVAEVIVRGRKLNRSMTETDELDIAIASKFRDGELHPAASLSFPDVKMVQQDYLRTTATKILPHLLPSEHLTSRAVSTIIREVLACAVMSPIMGLLSEPDTWNQIMENFGRSMLEDRSTVRRLRAALDEHAPTTMPLTKQALNPQLVSGDSKGAFEKFIRFIRRVNNLSEARRLRIAVASQLKKDSQEEFPDPVHIRRLEIGKRILDQKVQQLSSSQGSYDRKSRVSSPVVVSNAASTSRLETSSLTEILRDASTLSYFMEYMDRQRQMPLVQFWLVVDGLRNPLEEDALDDQIPATLPQWEEADRLDLQQMDQAYLSQPELKVTHPYRNPITEFLNAGSKATTLQYYRARKAILASQTAVLEQMQARYFEGFKKSDLFFKCLASQEAASTFNVVSTSLGPKPLSKRDSLPPSAPSPSKPAGRYRSSSSLNVHRVKKPARSFVHRREASADKQMVTSTSSLDDETSSLFIDDADDDNEADNMIDSTQSLESEEAEPRHHISDKQIVHAMEQALVDIIESDHNRPRTAEDLRASLFESEEPGSSSIFSDELGNDSAFGSLELQSASKQPKEREKPSLSSLGLVSPASRIGVFQDNDLFGDEDNLSDNHDENDEPNPDDDDDDEPMDAAPGDLGLAEAIAALTKDIDKLIAQSAIIESLTKKAELTNNTAELRILRKSKASLSRELRRKELQRQHYTIQESDNNLYGRAEIRISSTTTSKDEEGREFVMYVVEVQKDAGEQVPAAKWEVIRRYSEFHELHQKLRARYPSVRSLDFPGRRVVMKFHADFLRKRQLALEKYLRDLLLLPEVCHSRELRSFLSQSTIGPSTYPGSNPVQGSGEKDKGDRKGMITRLYDSVTDGVEDILGNIPVLDQLSLAGHSLIAAATNQRGTGVLAHAEDGTIAAEAEAEINAFENKDIEPFIKPICDIFLEVFELNRGNNWLRGRAVVVVLQQLLGGTIERKVRDGGRNLVQEDMILRYISMLMNGMWPNGQLNRDRVARTPQEKTKTRTEASLLLATLVPDLAGSVVGRANAQTASRRIFASLNNARLNTHLVFTLLDEVVQALFEEDRDTTSAGNRNGS